MKKVLLWFVAGAILSCSKSLDLELPLQSDTHEITEVLSIEDAKIEIDNHTTPINWNLYKIKKGNNFSEGLNFAPLNHDTIIAEFTFDTSAIYKTELPENQMDWCKLIGFSDCGGFHQQNSARIVWRWNELLDKIELGEYFYKKGTVSYNSLTEIAIGDTMGIMMYVTDSTYVINLGNIQSSSPRPCKSRANRYWLLPYFGGDEISPQDINIFINHIFPIPE